MCACYIYMSVKLCIKKPKGGIECLPLLLLNYCPETISITEQEVNSFGKQVLGAHLTLYPNAGVANMHNTTQLFTSGLGIQTQILALINKCSYTLSHLSEP